MIDKKIKDYPDLIKKDAGIVNTNLTEYHNALRRKVATQQTANKLSELSDRVDKIESGIDDIKKLLNKLIGE